LGDIGSNWIPQAPETSERKPCWRHRVDSPSSGFARQEGLRISFTTGAPVGPKSRSRGGTEAGTFAGGHASDGRAISRQRFKKALSMRPPRNACEILRMPARPGCPRWSRARCGRGAPLDRISRPPGSRGLSLSILPGPSDCPGRQGRQVRRGWPRPPSWLPVQLAISAHGFARPRLGTGLLCSILTPALFPG
jgi:hypothetical protein